MRALALLKSSGPSARADHDVIGVAPDGPVRNAA